ncbi:hypothetical protein N9L47_01845 [Rhodobacteraceae bacterium]|nr:hypothetical protein [Paracoccaceae bacterium]
MKREIEWELERNIRRLGHLDIAGGGQVVVQDGYAYIGHMDAPMGTSIIDVSDPSNPIVVSHIAPPDDWSHTHKVRVVGDIMITNVEQAKRHFLRKGDKIARLRADGLSDAQIADRLSVKLSQIPELEDAIARGYHDGGFRVWDISDKTAPKLLSYIRTHGFGVHRFDMDESYAYISTEMEGYVGNILVIYDLANPSNPTELSRWHMPGQHFAAGETPTWTGYGNRLHHAMRSGDELWAAVWNAGYRVLDVSDITNPKVIGSYRFPEAIPEPTHTIMPLEQMIDGKRFAIAIDEEHSHVPGRLHGFIWVIDVTDLNNMEPIAAWDLSERACPWVGDPGARFGGHQFREKLDSTLIYATWFAGGLRVLDVADPYSPTEVAHYMVPGADGTPPQSNDVDVDDAGLIYLLDRNNGLEILEMTL